MVDGRPARPAAERTVQIHNDRVRVSRRRFVPDAATGWHDLGFREMELKDSGSG